MDKKDELGRVQFGVQILPYLVDRTCFQKTSSLGWFSKLVSLIELISAKTFDKRRSRNDASQATDRDFTDVTLVNEDTYGDEDDKCLMPECLSVSMYVTTKCPFERIRMFSVSRHFSCSRDLVVSPVS